MAGEWMPPRLTMISRPRNCRAAPATIGADAGRAAAVERDVGHGRAAHDGQIGPRAHRGIEIADRRRGPLVGPVADRRRRHSRRGSRAFMSATKGTAVRGDSRAAIAESGGHRSRGVRRIGTGPSVPCSSPEKSMSVSSLRKNGRTSSQPQPAAPSCLPFGVVVGRAAQRDHAHHRGAAAHDAPLRKAGQRRIVGEPPMHLQVRPHIGVVVIGRPDRYRARRRARCPAACRGRLRGAAREWLERAERRLASTQPAAPPPTMMVSNSLPSAK